MWSEINFRHRAEISGQLDYFKIYFHFLCDRFAPKVLREKGDFSSKGGLNHQTDRTDRTHI